MKQKGFVPILIIILITVGALGYLGFNYFKTTRPINTVSNLPTQMATSLASILPLASNDPTSNWKSYSNTKFNFSFRYPPDLEYYPCPDIICGKFKLISTGEEVLLTEGIIASCDFIPDVHTMENAISAAICGCYSDGPFGSVSCDGATDKKTYSNLFGISSYKFALDEHLESASISNLVGKRFYQSIFFPQALNGNGLSRYYGLYFQTDKSNYKEITNQIFDTFRFSI